MADSLPAGSDIQGREVRLVVVTARKSTFKQEMGIGLVIADVQTKRLLVVAEHRSDASFLEYFHALERYVKAHNIDVSKMDAGIIMFGIREAPWLVGLPAQRWYDALLLLSPRSIEVHTMFVARRIEERRKMAAYVAGKGFNLTRTSLVVAAWAALHWVNDGRLRINRESEGSRARFIR